MSQDPPKIDKTPAGDREYLWFALLLMAVLTTFIDRSATLRSAAAASQAAVISNR